MVMNKNTVSCEHCSKEFSGNIDDYMCCNGYMCGCYGRPTEPVVCSMWCYCSVFYKRNGKKEIIRQYIKLLWLNRKNIFKRVQKIL